MAKRNIFINKRGKYKCPKCKEKFRLKLALMNHKCKGEPKNVGK